MKFRCLEDIDTLQIGLRHGSVFETHDPDEKTLVAIDEQGRRVAVTTEPAKRQAELGSFRVWRP